MNRLHARFFSFDKRLRILTTREPTYGPIGMQIRNCLTQDNDPKANAEKYLQWYCDDRKEHVQHVVRPFLDSANGENIHIIICDRYFYSTLAFQQAQGASWDQVWRPNASFPVPDKVIVLDIEPQVALTRISGRKKEKFEELEMMTIIRRNFLDLKQKLPGHPIVVLDASKPKSHVANAAWNEVKKLL